MDISTILNDINLNMNANLSNNNSIEENNSTKQIEIVEKKDMNQDEKLTEEQNNFDHIKQNISILSELIDSITNLSEELRKLYLILSIAYSCRNISLELDEFVEKNQGYFLMFQPSELERCADITQNEKYGNLVICRKILQFGIQVITREKTTNYHLLGRFYHRLIYLSPSRLQV